MKKNKSAIQKKKQRAKQVKKRIIENRLLLRKEKKEEFLREQAFEKEFNQKSNLGLSNEEIKQRLEHNMKILEELEKEYDHRPKDEKAEKVKNQVEALEEFNRLQNELLAVQLEKEEAKQKGEFTAEKAEQINLKLNAIAEKMGLSLQKKEII